MNYIPHTDFERREMLDTIGVNRIEDLFDAVPGKYRFPKLDLPKALSEMEVIWELQSLSDANADINHYACFLGAGAYNHFIPSLVDHIIRRGEFFTAYTPYQPEVSQGTLQAIFEFQSMIGNLTGMEICTASHYDGATAFAEAALMAVNITGRPKVIVSPGLHPHYRADFAHLRPVQIRHSCHRRRGCDRRDARPAQVARRRDGLPMPGPSQLLRPIRGHGRPG